MRGTLVAILVCGLALGACKKKGDEAASGGGGSGGGAKTLASFGAGDDYKAVIAAAGAGAQAVAEKKCDDAAAEGKKIIELLQKLVPDYGAIGEAAMSDKTLSDRMTTLNSTRGTLEMAVEGYEEDKEGTTAQIYCDQMGKDFQELAALP